MAPSQLGIFAKSSPDYATANLEFHVQPLSLDKFGDPLHAFAADHRSASATCGRRAAAASHAASADPARAAGDPARTICRRRRTAASPSIRCASRAASPRRRRWRASSRASIMPGAAGASDAELARAAGDIGTTIFHPVGTAKMGRDDDGRPCVDARLRVRGVAGLADRRRLGHAAHHLRQHQFADADDRREGGGDDSGRREGR